METRPKDNAIRQALAPHPHTVKNEGSTARLSSNFAYVTLRRIQKEQQQAERRQQRLAVAMVVGAALLGIGMLIYFCGETLWQSARMVAQQKDSMGLIVPTLFCLTFFALLNHWLAKHYRVKK